LLRANRLYGEDERLANATTFAAAFRGGCWPAPVSASQISRWETAATRAGFAVLRRYEQLLDLPPHRLIGAADWTYRQASCRPGPPVLGRDLDPADKRMHERIEQLLEQALSRELMTGAAWDELTSHLAVLPVVVLHPRTAWQELTERLLAELLIADGSAWLARTEALARLMIHPRARASIIAACGALAADTTNQVAVEPLTILDQVADPDANRHVLTQLRNPTGTHVLRGALRACVDKVARRHFTPTDLYSIAAVAVDLLTDADLDTEVRHLAAALLSQATAGDLGTVQARLREALDPTIRAVLVSGRTALPHHAAHILDRITTATLLGLRRPPPDGTDEVLARLLRELLFSPNINDVVNAGQLIAATPFDDPLGTAVAAELAAAPGARPVPLTRTLLEAMPWVGRPADRALVERFASSTDLPAPVVEAAAWRIGHVAGRSTDRFWRDAIRAHNRAWQRFRDPTSLSAVRGLIYALGVNRHHGMLETLVVDHTLPGSARAAARWWLDIPAHIHLSTCQENREL
jgi:hypothetical protein